MAGHSKWANIKHRKGAQDKKRSSLFAKLAREIIVAAGQGPDPEFNPRLRLAINNAKSNSLPKDRIEYAIKKGSGELQDGENFTEMTYEGYAPGGVAVIIEAVTDNKNRTASDVRSTLSKAGGSLGESGSVSFQFERIGLIEYTVETASEDEMFEISLEAGAENCETTEESHFITTAADDLKNVRDVLEAKYGDPKMFKQSWKPNVEIDVNENDEAGQKLLNLIDKLEDLDDAQEIYTNANFIE